ncbi:MAG: hypothetical protein DMG14_23955 [Acidobacteria bacterium]|nr:MAG: hypothetical protein DMG14_23955 [Acidobacteriota bacterium]
MRSRIVFKILLIILLILLAAPLLGALAMMASGSSMMAQMPDMMNGRMMGLATIWIALILLLIIALIVSIGRSMSGAREAQGRQAAAVINASPAGRSHQEKNTKGGSERDKAA